MLYLRRFARIGEWLMFEISWISRISFATMWTSATEQSSGRGTDVFQKDIRLWRQKGLPTYRIQRYGRNGVHSR